ncbi:UNVERIFIED_CONTAM: hypothetical protein GTU68_031142, partial [Idotea baltica]|nr:hypothetical protein [Idotea baltica]
ITSIPALLTFILFFQQLLERSFYAVTETCLAFTVFRDDFSPKFVSLFTVLLFLKAFHYLTDSRVDFMERSPVITFLFHSRVISLLALLMVLDLALLNYSYISTIIHGASVQLVFGFEYAILLTVGFNIGVKYICHSIDLRSENPWENKAVYLLYTELLVGLVKVVLYFIFLLIMIRIHTFPLFIIRPMYLTIRSFKNAMNDVVQSRRAIHNMNTLYPDATAEELAAVDNVCIICREEMTTGAKKLPCGHIFHSSCLRSWFQRQQTCPTCRMDILQTTAPLLNQGFQQQQQQPAAAMPQQQQQQNAPQQPAAEPLMAQFGQNLRQAFRPPHPFAAFPFFQQQFQQQQQQQQQQNPAATGSSPPGSSTTSTATGSATGSSAPGPKPVFPFGSMPPF